MKAGMKGRQAGMPSTGSGTKRRNVFLLLFNLNFSASSQLKVKTFYPNSDGPMMIFEISARLFPKI